MEPFRLETHTGKLIEARVFELKTAAHADEYARALAAAVARLPIAARPVLCADHRPVAIYPQEVADRLAELFTQMNSRLVRVAILVARSNATLTLQLNRIVREAAYENRKVFFDAPAATAWLTPELAPNEKLRLQQFLAELAAR
jgi:hypothetical protein